MVLVSIIMGIGVTTLLRGTIDLFRADADTRPSAVHLLWVLNLLLLHIVVWIIRWRAGGQAGWSFGEILLFLFVPIILFASAEWVFPPAGREVDLSTYFYDNRRVFFLLQGVLSLAMAIGPTLFFGGTGSSFTDFGSLFALPFVVPARMVLEQEAAFVRGPILAVLFIVRRVPEPVNPDETLGGIN